MRGLVTTAIVVMLCIPATGCVNDGREARRQAAAAASTSTTPAAPPLAETALRGLLLAPEQINPAMEAADMAVTRTHFALSDDSTTMEPRECLAIDGAAQSLVYAGSGYTAVREQSLSEGDDFAHFVDQAVVLFPSAAHASKFVETSAERWGACHQYRHIQSGTEWMAGAVSNIDGMLSTVANQENAGTNGWACGRALTARNNVVIDVNTCSTDPKDSAVIIADQIATKVSQIPAKGSQLPAKAPAGQGR